MIRTSRVFVYFTSCCTCVALICFLLASAALCSPAGQIKFTFNPPAGLACTEIVRSTQVMDFGRGAKRTHVLGSKNSISYTKNADGYLVSCTPVSTECIQDGKRFDDEGPLTYIIRLAMQAPITYQLNEVGDCTRVYGVEEFIKLLQKRAAKGPSAQIVASLQQYQEPLTAQVIAQWNALVAPFTYRSVRVGDVWKTSLDRALPMGGSTSVATKVRFLGWVNSGGKRWLKVQMVSSCSDAAVLQRCMDQAYQSKAATDADRALKPNVKNLSMQVTDVRLIDPTTMLYLSQSIKMFIKCTMEARGYGTKSFTISQNVVRSLSYRNQTVASR